MATVVNIIGFIAIFFNSCNANCVFSYNNGGKIFELDIRALQHATIRGSDNEYDYLYTPCRNGDECPTESGTDTGMATQQKGEGENEECYILANWDNGDTEPIFDEEDETWRFEYENGNECMQQTRKFFVYWNCEETAGDYVVTSAGEITTCEYEMYIDSKWACPGTIYIPSESNQLSAGTIFLIILVIVIILYFVVGWIICAFINQKDRGFGDVIGNIPHLTFWSKLPALVLAGCCFSKDFCIGLFSGKQDTMQQVTGGGNDEYGTIDD